MSALIQRRLFLPISIIVYQEATNRYFLIPLRHDHQTGFYGFHKSTIFSSTSFSSVVCTCWHPQKKKNCISRAPQFDANKIVVSSHTKKSEYLHFLIEKR